MFVRGEGSYLWDADGRRYIDLFPGWGVDGLGHCHPRVVAAIREQAGKLLHVANNYYMEPQARFAQIISERSFGGKCFFCNSGAEANEGAMKLARLATHAAAGKSRWKFITFQNSFHGRTLAAISATAQPKYHKGFEPIVPGFLYAPFNDLKAVEALVDNETCAILVEPIQGEGGVNVATPEFLQGLRKICDREGMILIFDEVQTGCGRTGKWFGYQHYGVTPDIMTLAKMLGGGAAIGAMVAQPKVADKLVPGTHASTFGGNPLACAAGIATFEAIEEENLLQNTVAVGRHTRARLHGHEGEVPLHPRGPRQRADDRHGTRPPRQGRRRALPGRGPAHQLHARYGDPHAAGHDDLARDHGRGTRHPRKVPRGGKVKTAKKQVFDRESGKTRKKFKHR